MIISRTHKYCFIEYPRSASYAIRRELLELYDGEVWCDKHSPYRDFVQSLPNEYQDYFVFCSIRSPLTDVVSIYNVNRTNNSGRAQPEFWKHYRWYIRARELRRAKFFQNNDDPSFERFFNAYFHLPYIKPRILSELKSGGINAIIRVEHLEEDFARVLKGIGLEQRRPVSKINVSTKDEVSLDELYPPSLRPKAVRVLGPMMRYMGYEFPPHWNARVPFSSELYFRLITPFARFFWDHVGYVKQRKSEMKAGGGSVKTT